MKQPSLLKGISIIKAFLYHLLTLLLQRDIKRIFSLLIPSNKQRHLAVSITIIYVNLLVICLSSVVASIYFKNRVSGKLYLPVLSTIIALFGYFPNLYVTLLSLL